MLKIKKIKLNGFRGILHEKEIDCSDNNLQTNSLVLYGPNSTGKTSFVDGIEWFLARTNQIDWLRRDQAKEAAYPHHAADESFVEIEFKKDGTDKTLRKTFDHNRVTIPTLEPEEEFSAVYDSFVIKPYLRYQEIVEFVLNSTGVEKYKKLAEWMGFEHELAFQKKMAEIAPELDAAISQLERNVQATESSLVTLSDNTIPIATDENILQYVNGLFSQSNETKELVIGSYQELSEKIPELEKLQIGSDRSRRLFTLTAAESYVESKSFSESLSGELSTLKNDLNSFKETESVARNVDTLSLYTKAQALLANEADGNVPCPVCHTEWEKDELIKHISGELASLESINTKWDELSRKIRTIKLMVASDVSNAAGIISKVGELADIVSIPTIKISEYKTKLEQVDQELDPNDVLKSANVVAVEAELAQNANIEKQSIIDIIKKTIKELKPSEDEERLSKNIEKIKRLSELWGQLIESRSKKDFYTQEVGKFNTVSARLNEMVRLDIQSRFDEVSGLIRTYFGMLRSDKDIKDIQITYNVTGRADSRSAEIELLYYDIGVRPAYKVLSESLLSSLGLSVYFACVKKFNTEAKFIILDDVINSLDGHNRPNLINLLVNEFSDYQIIVFTHDRLWFDQIKQRCPSWVKKKIIDWTYESGPQIGLALTTREELQEKLKDDTQAESAGRDFGEHVEGILNQIAEGLEARLRYRYSRQDPPTLTELFEAVNSRLKELKQKGAIDDSQPIMANLGSASNDDPFIRNVCSHDRRNYEGFLTAQEVLTVVNGWFDDVESLLVCNSCHRPIAFNRGSNKVVCQCGNTDLSEPIKVVDETPGSG